MVVDAKTGKKAEFGSDEMIIEVFKKKQSLNMNNNDVNLENKLLQNNILKFY